jgi:fatty-acyl-CoA synthase
MNGSASPVTAGIASVATGAALASEPGLGALTIGEYLREVTTLFAAREALAMRTTDHVVRWSYATLWERSAQVARALLAAGVGKDGRVGVLMSNRPEFLAAVFGIALAGGVSVPLSTFSTPSELEHLLKASCVSILLFEKRIAKKDFAETLRTLEPAIATAEPGQLASTRFPFLRRVVTVDAHTGTSAEARAIETWSQFLQRGNATLPELVQATAASVKPSDLAVLFFSSGTTSLPKGILHSHRAVAIQWWRWPRVLSVEDDVRCWTANGFFWSGNFSMVIGCTLSTGGTLVLQPNFQPEEALELIATERVTIPLAWPHQWARLEGARNWNEADLHALRYVDPGSPMGRHPTVSTHWYEPPAYGTTETLTIVAALPVRAASEKLSNLQGPPLAGNIIKIVDPVSGAVLPRGQRGEIAVKGPTLMLGYLGVPADETLDPEGFFRTGDGGYMDDEARLFWEGRLTDIIKTGGANVSPREIDAALTTVPGVKLSRTVGVPHETLGEMVVACIVPQDGALLDETTLREFLKARLASYKVPRRILFFREDELAMTGSDKVKATALVQAASQRLRSTSAPP